MSLIDATRALLDAIRSSTATPESLRDASQAVQQALAACEDPEQIERALALDADDDLPIGVKSAAFERRLEIGSREPAILRQFAEHLWLHGPERDAEAAALRREADDLDAAKDGPS
ncbi:hypothetical protein WMF04_23980 [Sorangium sp. So ce260]|uniref:hypothetical protein n=1 Tax=Sorangium sp. So ce260 TaxID=3133291 RepID=UPI003F5FA584